MTRTVGSFVEVVSNPVMANRGIQTERWVRVKVEPVPQSIIERFGTPDDGTIYVRIGGMLVSRSPQYVRPEGAAQ